MKATIFAALAIVALFLYDCVGGTTEKINAVVVGREYVPEHTTWETDSKGHTRSTHHPADYTLIVQAEGKTKRIDANLAGYYSTFEGQQIVYTQRRGCMSHVPWMQSYYK